MRRKKKKGFSYLEYSSSVYFGIYIIMLVHKGINFT